MSLTPLGRLIADLIKIKDETKKHNPKVSLEIQSALLRYDPDLSNGEHVRALVHHEN